jgi:transcriptional regulator NrdR family protein
VTRTHASHMIDHDGLKCPACGSIRSSVRESRSHKGFRFRVRRCVRCKAGYTTVEQIVDTSLYDIVVKGRAFKVVE